MNVSRVWVTVAVMAATIMQVLDTTIINVALPHMIGELGASPDTISWVLTSYLIASAVFMPLAGFFTDRFGRKKYLLVSIAGFVIASALCGLANGLPEMVLFRLLQGIFGAALVPLSQAVMVDTYPIEARGKAMAIWGMGVMAAPILGPSLGGYLTEIASWRWSFYINVPVGIVSFLLALRFVPDTPMRARRMDWLGFGALALAIACGQLVLDRGAGDDWFDSSFITLSTLLALAALLVFVWKSLAGKGHPVFDLAVLRDRNFAVACLISLATGMGVYGGMLLLPLYLENLLGFPTMDAGMYLVPRGLATFVSMSLVGHFSGRISARTMVATGLLLSVAGAWMMTGITPQTAGSYILWPMVLQGMGMGLIFVPMSTLAFATIPPQMAAEAAGLYSLTRTLGSAIGISVVSTYLSYSTRVNWAELRQYITPYNAHVQQFLAPLHLNIHGGATGVLGQVVQQQASVQGFVSTFWLITLSFVVLLPLLLLIKSVKGHQAALVVAE